MDQDLQAAQQALALGANHQAFEIFFMMEQSNTDSNFINCCRMAMRGQLSPENQKVLFERLDEEVRMRNGRVTYNYALVVEKMGGQPKKVIELLEKAIAFGVVEASSSLNKFVITGAL